MAPASTRLWLFRPCEHAWDAAQRLRGSTNLPATPDSLAELRQRVARLAVGPDVVYHPGDDASAETAHGIATRFACALRADPDLSDPDLGLLEGLSLAEFERRFESRSLEWAESPLTVEPPEGEPLADARLRILAAFAAAGVTPRIAEEVWPRANGVGLVRAGLGATFMTPSEAKHLPPEVTFLRLVGPAPESRLVLGWRQGAPPEPALASFLAVAGAGATGREPETSD